MKRHNSQRGETLMESLGSILIFTFASVALLTMLTTANTMNQLAEAADGGRQTGKILWETPEGEITQGKVTIHIGSKHESVPVIVKGDEESGYVFYLTEAKK